jgi:hypothetical protein
MTLALCHVRHATGIPPSLAGHSSARLPELPPLMAGSMDDTLQPGLLYAYWAAPDLREFRTKNCTSISILGSRAGQNVRKARRF